MADFNKTIEGTDVPVILRSLEVVPGPNEIRRLRFVGTDGKENVVDLSVLHYMGVEGEAFHKLGGLYELTLTLKKVGT